MACVDATTVQQRTYAKSSAALYVLCGRSATLYGLRSQRPLSAGGIIFSLFLVSATCYIRVDCFFSSRKADDSNDTAVILLRSRYLYVGGTDCRACRIPVAPRKCRM